jgi:hypothetical protein
MRVSHGFLRRITETPWRARLDDAARAVTALHAARANCARKINKASVKPLK